MRKEEGELFQGCIYTSGLKQLNWKVSLENSEQPGAREGGNLLYHLPTKKLPSDNPELPCLYCSLPSVRQQKWHWWPRCVMDIGLVGVTHIIPLFSHHFPLRWTPPSILILPRQGWNWLGFQKLRTCDDILSPGWVSSPLHEAPFAPFFHANQTPLDSLGGSPLATCWCLCCSSLLS